MIDETIAEIREMQTHSSSIVAVKATAALADLREREYTTLDEFERDVEHNAGALRRANPSHASLHRAMGEVTDAVLGEATSVGQAKRLLGEATDRVIDRIETGKREAAARTAETITDGETILTHDYSSTVLDAIDEALDTGIEITAYVTEARPRYLGRKTARRLAERDGVDVHLLVDAAAGHYLSNCDRVLLGMDCVVGEEYYNRVGTFPIAVSAAHHDVPVHVAGSGTKIVSDGFRFENEFRPPSEVMREPVDGVTIENPAYEATPVSFVDQIITDQGIERP